MAWLARLDARAQAWPRPLRWCYVGLKWYLVIMGGFALAMTYLQRIFPSLSERLPKF